MWLSNRDLCQAMEHAGLAENIGFAVLNLMSDNPVMRWDLTRTRGVIGYAPRNGASPVLPEVLREDEKAAHDLRAMADRLLSLIAEHRGSLSERRTVPCKSTPPLPPCCKNPAMPACPPCPPAPPPRAAP
jgi:hypothetical protein